MNQTIDKLIESSNGRFLTIKFLKDNGEVRTLNGRVGVRWGNVPSSYRRDSKHRKFYLIYVPHVMRHTFCSRLVQRGVDIVTVSKLAGHSSIVVTMRYAHLAPDSLAHAIRKLEEPAKDVNPQARHTTQVVSR